MRYDDVIGKVNGLLEMYQSPKLRDERSGKMQAMVDGKGAWRIVEAIKGL